MIFLAGSTNQLHNDGLFRPLQWHHMSAMASQIIGNPTVCSLGYSGEHEENTGSTPHEGSVTFHDVTITMSDPWAIQNAGAGVTGSIGLR